MRTGSPYICYEGSCIQVANWSGVKIEVLANGGFPIQNSTREPEKAKGGCLYGIQERLAFKGWGGKYLVAVDFWDWFAQGFRRTSTKPGRKPPLRAPC